MRTVNVRTQIVEPEAVNRGIGSCGVEVRCIHLRNFAPRSQLRWSYVFPTLSAIARHVDQPIVTARPDQRAIFRRRCNRINHSPMLALGRIGIHELPQARRHSGIFARQIRTDNLPTLAAITRREQHIRSQIEDVLVDGRENQRSGAIETVLAGAQHNR